MPTPPHPYTLIPAAETGERFSDFFPYVASINNLGTVAFQAALADGGSGVFTSRDSAIDVIADHTTALITPITPITAITAITSHPAIADDGSICFYAAVTSGASAVMLLKRGDLITVAPSHGPLGPTINQHGAIAFRAVSPTGSDAIFTSNSNAATLIAEVGDKFSAFRGLPVINSRGEVCFRADHQSGGAGIYTLAKRIARNCRDWHRGPPRR